MKPILLKGQRLSKQFVSGGQTNTVLQNVDISLYEGDFTVIMGASGAGKSTLLYALSGMDNITSGEVWYRERPLSALSEKEQAALRGKEFGFVFQQTHLVSNLTLLENILVAGYVSKKFPPQEVRQYAAELLCQMGVESAKDRLPAQVSGGEAQRAAIARAMIAHPGLLFADEPTGALNRSSSEEVLGLLTRLHTEGQSIVMVTHDAKAALHGNRILYLEDGTIMDELSLPDYGKDDLKQREETVTRWLSRLQW